ncbi:MAG: aldo/keto reductase [Oscillospiraceae bacterium]|nr:aldo/keto reductase [Oscillospiraceae bacterium]
MEYFTLNNGNRIPAIGSGTNSFGKEGGFAGIYTGTTKEMNSCIEAGYRLFDTAESYGNEEVIGTAVRDSGISRSEFFIETKMKIKSREGTDPVLGRKETEDAIARSLDKLKTDYIDVYMMHHPVNTPEELREIWAVFEEQYDRGVLRNIGVCNFTPKDLDELLSFCRVKPVIDQIRINPETPSSETVDYCRRNGIVPMAWGPLNFSRGRDELAQIAGRYGVSWSKLLLNYNWRNGVISIPKSHDPAHQKDNIDVFGFSISDEDMDAIRGLCI